MPQLTRHQIGTTLLSALRQEGFGIRDLFEGRQEPATWFFRCLAYDQSELDIMESGAVETLHAPSALVELTLDEVALACAAIGIDGLASYLTVSPAPGEEEGEPVSPEEMDFDPGVMLGFLNLDVAPPGLWLDERESEPAANERLAGRLSEMAQEIGHESDSVEVHIEGSLDATGGWADPSAHVRPAGVSIHFTFDIPLAGTGEPELARVFAAGARTASIALERMREVFREA
ncbi:MAG: hypothetical protein ACE5JR_05120 [Gemmatimonadota bacterium]